MKLKNKIKLWWDRLWIRKDESHRSLDMDVDIMLDLSEDEMSSYIKDLTKRRSIAHERDLER